MRNVATILLCTGLSWFSACAVGPNYAPPKVDVGQSWSQSVSTNGAEVSEWWRRFDDPTLDRLIEQAQEHNRSVRQALSRVAEARAVRDASSGGRSPVLDAKGSVTKRRQSENGPLPIGVIPGVERDQTIYETGFDALWELDLFGRTRRSVEAADARVEAAVHRSEATQLTIAAEVARSYLTMRGLQRERTAVESGIELARRTQQLIQRQYELGEVAQAQVAQTDAEVATVTAELPLLDAEIHAAALALGTLIGGLPESQLNLLSERTDYPELAPLPVGERAELLRRRPDVLAAERQVAAATAEIGATTAELFPRLAISASGSFQSLDAGELFDSASEAWGLTPLISWRIFDGGRIRANIRASEARARTAALAYEEAVLAALSDAEQSLSRYHYGLAALDQQAKAVAATQRNYDLAQIRYRAGDIALLELLDAERTLRQADARYARTHLATEIDLVALCKALGGGWQPATPGTAMAQSASAPH